MKRVLEVLNQYPGETFIQEHVRAIQQHCHNIDLMLAYTQTSQTGKLRDSVQGIPTFAWPNYNLMPAWKQWMQSIRYPGNDLVKLHKPQRIFLQRLNPDHVHFHFSPLAVKYSHLCRELNIPYSFSVRGSDVHALHPEKDATYIEQLKACMQNATAVHAVADYLKTQLEELTGYQNAKVIYTCVSDEWSKIEREPQHGLLIAIGRLTWQKGFPDLLLAAARLKQQQIAFQLVIIGEGPQRPELEYMIRDLNLSDCVSLTGYQTQSQILSWLQKAHLFVLSSIAEGFPNVLAEAMMAKVPVLSSDCGGVPELLVDNVNGALYHNGSIHELAAKIAAHIQHDSPAEIIHQAQVDVLSRMSTTQHALEFNSFFHATA